MFIIKFPRIKIEKTWFFNVFFILNNIFWNFLYFQKALEFHNYRNLYGIYKLFRLNDYLR